MSLLARAGIGVSYRLLRLARVREVWGSTRAVCATANNISVGLAQQLSDIGAVIKAGQKHNPGGTQAGTLVYVKALALPEVLLELEAVAAKTELRGSSRVQDVAPE